MAKRQTISVLQNYFKTNLDKLSSFGCITQRRKLHNDEVPVKEIKIPVKWGHLSAKLWGGEHERPVLALHGWQDNAGTWDTLAPLLYKNQPILAVDLPGHGLSSWIPPGFWSLEMLGSKDPTAEKSKAQAETKSTKRLFASASVLMWLVARTIRGSRRYPVCGYDRITVDIPRTRVLLINIGMHYYSWELPRIIHYLKNYFKWDKVSFLSHSMGSIASFRYACLFPEDVDFFIAFDILIYDNYDLILVIEKYCNIIQKLELEETRLDKEPPSYSLPDISKIWHLGTKKSIALETVPHLLKRGSKPSKNDPDKFYFSRDPRLKHMLFNPENQKFIESLALRVKCPLLYVKGADSPYAIDDFATEMQDLVANNNPNFEKVLVPGTHHLHLNNAENVAPIITEFLKRHKFWA